MTATTTIAARAANGDFAMTPAPTARMKAIVPAMTMYSPDRSGMSAALQAALQRSRRIDTAENPSRS